MTCVVRRKTQIQNLELLLLLLALIISTHVPTYTTCPFGKFFCSMQSVRLIQVFVAASYKLTKQDRYLELQKKAVLSRLTVPAIQWRTLYIS